MALLKMGVCLKVSGNEWHGIGSGSWKTLVGE